MSRLITRKQLCNKMGTSRSTLNEFQGRELITTPIKFGRRNLWPEHEIDTIIGAKLAGQSNEQIRELVRQLHEARKQAVAA